MEEENVCYVTDAKVTPIEDSIKEHDIYQSVIERYYTKRYCLDAGNKEGNDHCVLFHTNRICLITLAESHPIIKERKEVREIDFHVSENVDRLKNRVSGKGKHGAQFLQVSSPLCFIECTDGSKYTVYSCIKGKLVEINDALIENPKLLIDKPFSEGYIAIVLPNIINSEQQKGELLTSEEYKTAIEMRKASGK